MFTSRLPHAYLLWRGCYRSDTLAAHRPGYMIVDGPSCSTEPRAVAGWFKGGKTSKALGDGRYLCDPVDNGTALMLAEHIKDALRGADLLGDDMEVPVEGVHALYDTAASAAQMLHYDWPEKVAACFLEDDVHMPLSAIWAPLAPFALQTATGEKITVNKGKMIVFRADFEHGGWGYMSSLHRVHAYVRPKGQGVRLPKAVYTR